MLARWVRENAELVKQHQCEMVREVRWVDRHTFGARVFPKGAGAARRSDCEIEMNAGLQFAVDDLMCAVFAQRSFLKDYRLGLDAVTDPLVLNEGGSPRFIGYPTVAECLRDPLSLVTAIPQSPTRLRGAAALSELCLDWVHLHEQSHFLLGHFDLLERRKQAGIVQIDEEALGLHGGTRPPGFRLRRIMEYQADAFALELLFLHYLAPSQEKLATFEDGYLALDLDMPAILGAKPDLVAFRRVARVLIVSAAIVALMIEHRTQADATRGYHPLPSGRVLSLITNGANITRELAAHLLVLRGVEAPVQSEMGDVIARLATECLTDLMLAAMVLGVRDPSLRYDWRAERPLDTDFSDDLFRVMGAEAITADVVRTLATPGAKEFAAMQPRSDAVFAHVLTMHHGGALLRGRT